MWANFKFKPKDIRTLVEKEPWSHKARIIVFSLLMASSAGYYRYWFDGMVARSAQMQAQALAGMNGLNFQDAIHKDSYIAWSMRKNIEVMERNDFDTLQKMYFAQELGLVTQTYTQDYLGINTVQYAGPNGDPLIQDFYVQTPDSAAMEAYEKGLRDKYAEDPIGWWDDRYEEWKKMRDGTLFYDTAACVGTEPVIGLINDMAFSPVVRLKKRVENADGTVTYESNDNHDHYNWAMDGETW